MNLLLAQVGRGGTWSLQDIIIAIIIVAAAIGVLYIALRAFGVTIPPWVINIFWIVVVAFVAVVAVRFIFSL